MSKIDPMLLFMGFHVHLSMPQKCEQKSFTQTYQMCLNTSSYYDLLNWNISHSQQTNLIM